MEGTASPRQIALPLRVVLSLTFVLFAGTIAVLGWLLLQAENGGGISASTVLLVEQPGNVELYRSLIAWPAGIQGNVDTQSQLITITVEASSSEQAQSQADAIASQLIEIVSQLQSTESNRRMIIYDALREGAAKAEQPFLLPDPSLEDLAPKNFGAVYIYQEGR